MGAIVESIVGTLAYCKKYIRDMAVGAFSSIPLISSRRNQFARTKLAEESLVLEGIQQKIVDELNDKGISIVHLSELFGSEVYAKVLQEKVINNDYSISISKPYLELFVGDPSGGVYTISLESPLLRFSLDKKILDVVNSYVGSWSKLVHVEMSRTRITIDSTDRIKSQRWHRDPGIGRIVKVFMYLSDVESGSGAFQFAAKSHKTGTLFGPTKKKKFGMNGRYPENRQLLNLEEKYQIVSCYGKQGSIVFADTTGIHRGGYARDRRRIMTTSVYYPDADVVKRKFRLDSYIGQVPFLNQASQYAVD